MARGLKFCIKKEEVLYYPSSENKGADQLRGYREADLRLCFRICKTLVSQEAALNKCGIDKSICGLVLFSCMYICIFKLAVLLDI